MLKKDIYSLGKRDTKYKVYFVCVLVVNLTHNKEKNFIWKQSYNKEEKKKNNGEEERSYNKDDTL